VKQGGFAPQGKWTGSALGGVKAPEAILLPDLGTRFFKTATRLETLAAGHPMEDWLRFMAKLAHAQHLAIATLSALAGLDPLSQRPIDVLADRERYTDELAKQFAYHSGEGDD
jgi:FdhE protein